MKFGDVVTITVTNRSLCVCGNDNKGQVFRAVYVGGVNNDFGSGKRFDPIDFKCAGCGVMVDEHIEYDSADATDAHVATWEKQ